MIVGSRNNRSCFNLILGGLLTLTGCGIGVAPSVGTSSNSAVVAAAAAPTGEVFGGQQAIGGASVMLYAVNTNATAATALMTAPVTTATGTGSFTLGNYVANYSTLCTNALQVYILATGGNPGSGTNTSIALMSAIGSCSSLTSSTHIKVNEATTAAAVWALQQFIGVSEGTPYAEDIATNTISQSATGMANAFLTAQQLVPFSTGSISTAANPAIESTKLYAIANVLAACVNSTGSGDCPSLFAAVTPAGSITPGDTIQAALYMARNPGYNVPNVFALQPTTPPFQPTLTTAPFDWSLSILYTGDGLNLPNLITNDAAGNIFASNSLSGSNGIVEITPAGAAAANSPYLAGSAAFSQPQAIVPDTLGNIWVSAHSTSSSTGNRLVSLNPATGASTSYPLTSGCDPYALTIDGQDNLFFNCSALGYVYELPNQTSGTPSSTNLPSYPVSPTQLGPIGSESYGNAIDALGNLWVANTITSSGSSVTEYNTGAYTAATNTFTPSSGPVGIAVDHSNNAWTVAASTLDEFVYNSAGNYTFTDFTGGGLSSGKYVAIDGAGDVWVANGTPATVTTGTGTTTYATVSEFSNAGAALTPGISATQPGGLSTALASTSPAPRGITIDPSGNVWIAGCGVSTSCSSTNGSFLLEYVGAASPPVTPLASAVASNQLGCCSFTPAPPTGTTPTNTAGTINFVIPAAVNSNNNYAFTQNNGSFSFEVTRTGGFNGALTINYATSNGSAIAGTDYTAESGTLSWANGDSSVKTITVPWLHNNNNSTYAGTKTFSITLTCSSTTCPVGYSPNNSELVTVTDNLTPPSIHFTNFNGATVAYYLGLPVDQYGGTGGVNGSQFAWQTIAPSVLAAGFSDPYFYLNSSNQMVFTAPSNGATSSPGSGSDDTRSELREYYYGTGKIDTDDWDSSVGGTLTATAEVNAVSIDTDEATVGQIHGQVNPFALLEYQPTSSTQGNLVLAVVNTNTTNSPSTNYTIATGINLGTFFSYTLKLSGSQLTATVNGASVTAMPVTVDSSWVGTCGGSSCTYDDGMYFKFGAYSGASNTGNPAGDQTQVTFSAFTVTHP